MIALPLEAMVDRLIGVVCVTYRLQMHLGQRLSADPLGQQRRRQWTVTNRVSWFWGGQRLFNDPGYDWSAWLAAQWTTLRTPQAMAVHEPVPTSRLAKAA